MSVAGNLLEDLAGIGATIKPAGERLILRAGRTAIPAALVSRVRTAKADLLTILAAGADHPDLGSSDDRKPTRDRIGDRTLRPRIVLSVPLLSCPAFRRLAKQRCPIALHLLGHIG